MSTENPAGGHKKPPIPTPAKKLPAFNIDLRGDRLYKVETLHKWFAVSSLVLFAITVGMLLQDYSRGWKKYQREFVAKSIARANDDLTTAKKAVDAKALADVNKQLEDAKAEEQKKAGEIAAAQKELDGQKSKFYAVNQNFQFEKAKYDADKYACDEENAHKAANAKQVCDKMEATGKRMDGFLAEREQLTLDMNKTNAKLAEFKAKQTEGLKKLEALTQEQSRIEIRLSSLNPGAIVTAIRNSPVMDMLNPSEKVQQILLSNLYNDHPFKQVARVDRCTTCHLGIDQKVWEKEKQPFKTHPKLDLFLSANSPHPAEKFGCTSCHSGLDRATSFQEAGHTPKDEKQKEEWKKKYGWHVDEFLETPMLAADKVEAGCYKCHSGGPNVPGAPKLSEGRDLIRIYGCFGCHRIPGYENTKKVGPDLSTVSGKLTKDWVRKWLANPKEFKPEARMPKFWNNSNNSGTLNGVNYEKRNEAEINAVTEYLWSKSKPKALALTPKAGNAAKGKDLVEKGGCFGCHVIGAIPVVDDADLQQIRRRHGYNLENQGSKVSAAWIYNWVKDPSQVWSGTKMPSLRLTDDEAADIAAYLSSLKNPAWESKKPADVDAKALDDVTLELLRSGSTEIEAKETLKGMSAEQKNLFAGERLVGRYGCFACHNVPGFEKAQPIGTELTEAGSKLISQLDFGFIEMEHNRGDWYAQKLRDPRGFDKGRVKRPDELLRMPNFGFDEKQVGSIAMVLTSLVKDRVPQEMRGNPSPAVAAGRQLIAEKNCRTCHIIEGMGRERREWVQDISAVLDPEKGLPPSLNTQGMKTQPMWLHDFLKDPGKTKLRPYLDVRMPTFHFTENELSILTQYFSAYDKAPYPFISTDIESTPELMKAGETLFNKFQCVNCHSVGSSPRKLATSIEAPNFGLAADRLRPEWVPLWLKDPQAIAPGTSMPSYWQDGKSQALDILKGDSALQMRAIREYLFLSLPGIKHVGGAK